MQNVKNLLAGAFYMFQFTGGWLDFLAKFSNFRKSLTRFYRFSLNTTLFTNFPILLRVLTGKPRLDLKIK